MRAGRGVVLEISRGDEALPLWLERRHVDDDAATRISGLTDADGQHVAWDPEVLDRARQGKRVGRNDGDIGLHADERALVELLGIDDGRVDVGEDLELVGHAQVVAVRRETEGDNAFADLLLRKGIDHIVLGGHFADPTVTLDGHGTPWDGQRPKWLRSARQLAETHSRSLDSD